MFDIDHEAAQRPRRDRVDQVIEVPLDACPDCQFPSHNKPTFEQSQTDIPPVEPVVKQFNDATQSQYTSYRSAGKMRATEQKVGES